MIDEELARYIAEALIVDATTDVEYLTIGESFQDDPRVRDYTDEELQNLADAVDGLVSRAEVEVSFRG